MKKIILSILTFLAISSGINAQTLTFDWVKAMGGSGSDVGRSIAYDALGNVYTSGYFNGTVDFNPGGGVSNLTSNGETDIFIQKLDANGNFVWAKSFGGSKFDRSFAIAVDASNNVYTTGDFNGTVDFDPGAGTSNLVATGIGPRDIFIQKLDANGNFVWAKSMGNSSADDHTGYSIAVDASGNVHTTGFFQGTVDFNPGGGVSNLTSNGSADIYIQKLDVNGNFVWAKSIGGSSFDRGHSISLDALGNVYTTGFFQNTADFDPGTGTSNLTSNGNNDIFIQKLDVSGNFVWAKNMGSFFSDIGNSIAVDGLGNVYTTGSFDNGVDFDPGAGVSTLVTHGANDIFIQKLDANGDFVWAKSMGGTSTDVGNSITVDVLGNIYTTGYYQGTVDFDPGAGTSNLSSAIGSRDIFIQKLDASGNFIWVKSMGTNVLDYGYSIAVDASLNIYTVGSFGDSFGADFNPEAGTSYIHSNGGDDVFIQKLQQCENTGTDVQIACNTYTWIDGNTYTSSNSAATHTLTNIGGCDSVVTLNLTLNNSNTGTDVQIACNTFTWINGNTYTSSNSAATHTLTNIGGCDSVVTLNLTLNNSNTGTDTQIACNTFTWIDGNTYTSSNSIATHTLTNIGGCDSVVTLNLTLNNSNTGTDVQIACNTFTWIDGNTYTSSNSVATHTLTNVGGCDSVVTLNLTINNSNTGTDTQIACNTYTWIDGNTYTSSNSAATHTLTNIGGCDSVVTLNLTLNNSNTGTDTQIACNTYAWIDGNTYTSSNSAATHTLTNVGGCDSVVTLNLTLNNSNTGTDTQIACNTYAWIDGNTYTSSNSVATHTLTNVVGCDSVVTLNLTLNNSNTGTDTQIACNTYAWIDGNTYTSSNNVATHTLTNITGCDSVVTLNLTINANAATDIQIACDTYTWIDGNTYTSSNNVATHTLTNVVGCDSVVTLNLTINIVDVTTALAGTIISANNILATSYQWIDCLGNSVISGATNVTFTATVNGDYAVIITENSCIDTSACVTVVSVGIKEVSLQKVSIYPNPVTNQLTLRLRSVQAITNISIIDVTGKTVKIITGNANTINVSDLTKGIYFLQVQTENGLLNSKFIKE